MEYNRKEPILDLLGKEINPGDVITINYGTEVALGHIYKIAKSINGILTLYCQIIDEYENEGLKLRNSIRAFKCWTTTKALCVVVTDMIPESLKEDIRKFYEKKDSKKAQNKEILKVLLKLRIKDSKGTFTKEYNIMGIHSKFVDIDSFATPTRIRVFENGKYIYFTLKEIKEYHGIL